MSLCMYLSKCPILIQVLRHASVHRIHPDLSHRLILCFLHYQTPCIIFIFNINTLIGYREQTVFIMIMSQLFLFGFDNVKVILPLKYSIHNVLCIVASLFTLADCRVNYTCIARVDRLSHPVTLNNL